MEMLKSLSRYLKVAPFFIIAIHFILLLNLKFTAWPEMLAWPYLIAKGWLPYRDIAIAHTPLLLSVLSVYLKLFGVGLGQLKTFTWLLILASDSLLFWVVKKLWGARKAILALVIYVPLQIFYEGNGLWFDLALAPLAILIYYNLRKGNYLWSGICLGLALLTKQTACWFLIPTLWMVIGQSNAKAGARLKLLIEGVLAAFLPVLIIGTILKILPDFFGWVIKFGIFYLPRASGQILYPSLRQLLAGAFPFVILAAFLFKKGKGNLDLLAWSLFGAMGAYPRFEFFHFQPAIAFLAIAVAIVYSSIRKNEKVGLGGVMLAGYLIITLVLSGKFIVRNWGMESRFFEPEVIKTGTFIKDVVRPGERIYVRNYWDSIYALTDTLPGAKPLVPYLSWYLEIPGVKNSLISQLKMDLPQLIVSGNTTPSGLGSYKWKELDELTDRFYSNIYKTDEVEVFRLNK